MDKNKQPKDKLSVKRIRPYDTIKNKKNNMKQPKQSHQEEIL